MDGDFSARSRDVPPWVRPNRSAKWPAPETTLPRARAAMFLQRDLNDEALRKPVAPVFSHAELEAVRQEGFDTGRAAGLAAAAGSQEAFRTASEVHALGVISAAIKEGSWQAAAAVDEVAASLAKTLVAAMNAVMPALIMQSGLQEITAMLGHVLPGLSREPAIRIEVAPSLAGYIEATLNTLAAEQRARISIIAADHMGSGDARVHWGAGHAQRQPAQVWQAVMDTLHPLLGNPDAKDTGNGE